MSNESINYLEKSPIFASSLGSKELFHSNIWAYLIEQNTRYLNVFFKGLDIENDPDVKKEVYREKLNMDVIVEVESDVFVIENKIKSLPREDQLKDYAATIDTSKEFSVSGRKLFCLTGIPKDKPKFLKDPWNYYADYKYISEKIKEVTRAIPFNEGTKHFWSFALEYAEMINNLSDLLAEKEKELEGVFYFPQYYKENGELKTIQEKLRIDDILQKLNADQFREKVMDKLRGIDSTIVGNSGYTNQRSLAEFYYEATHIIDKKNIEYFRIGVQIQNAQFRWYVEDKKKDDKKPLNLMDDGRKFGWFSEYTGGEKINLPIGGEESTGIRIEKDSDKGEQGYCQFCRGDSKFVYQYFKIVQENNGCSFDNLSSLVIAFMQRAKEIKDKYAKEYGFI